MQLLEQLSVMPTPEIVMPWTFLSLLVTFAKLYRVLSNSVTICGERSFDYLCSCFSCLSPVCSCYRYLVLILFFCYLWQLFYTFNQFLLFTLLLPEVICCVALFLTGILKLISVTISYFAVSARGVNFSYVISNACILNACKQNMASLS